MTIIETMQQRRSVRNYDGRGISDDERDELLKAIQLSSSPFGGKLSIQLKKFNLKEGYKPGTYGMIKGAEDFFVIIMGTDEQSYLSVGYRFEQIVLRAWQLGLGTCWIAATFNNSDFEKGLSIPNGEKIGIVSPVGHAAEISLKEKIIRLSVRSAKRKPFNELFFFEDFHHPVSENNNFYQSLEMVRLAPSSTNSQPWRAIVIGETVHFYYKPKSILSITDSGIGLCHFHEAEKYFRHNGDFFKTEDYPHPPHNWKYLISYSR